MYTLYERFLQQLKKEQIQKYNEKHRDYLVRCGKIKDVKPQKENNRGMNRSTTHVRPKKEQINQENMEDQITVVRQTINHVNKSDQRPLKGAQNYKIDNIEMNNQPQKTIRPAKKIEVQPRTRQMNKKMAQPTIKQQPIQQVKSQFKPQFIQEKVIPKLAPSNNEEPEEFEQIVLVECPEGCGKKFKQSVLQKHIKLCQKGQKKRKVFKVKIVDEQAEQLKKQQPKPKHNQQKKQEIPKWKKQSNQLRNVVNITKNLANGAPPPPPLQEQDDRIQCQGCGRKFKEIVAQKHIPNCIKRNKGKK